MEDGNLKAVLAGERTLKEVPKAARLPASKTTQSPKTEDPRNVRSFPYNEHQETAETTGQCPVEIKKILGEVQSLIKHRQTEKKKNVRQRT